jgi:hypothetical protein
MPSGRQRHRTAPASSSPDLARLPWARAGPPLFSAVTNPDMRTRAPGRNHAGRNRSVTSRQPATSASRPDGFQTGSWGSGRHKAPPGLSLAHQYDQFSHLPGGFGPMGGSGALSCTKGSRKPGSSQIFRSRPHHDTPSSQQAPQPPAVARVRQPARALPIPKTRTGLQRGQQAAVAIRNTGATLARGRNFGRPALGKGHRQSAGKGRLGIGSERLHVACRHVLAASDRISRSKIRTSVSL